MRVPFDQYQRYRNIEKTVNSVRREGERFTVLEVGANEHSNLDRFLPQDDIKYLDLNLSEKCLSDPRYILGDATDMPFEDNSFDIVVALDVYEHIPPERRENFLSEINRVCSVISVICAPMNRLGIMRAEERTNEVYKNIHGEDFIWLKEHFDNVLPDFDRTKRFYEEHGIKCTTFCHGTLEVWEALMSICFLSTVYPEAFAYRLMIDEFYNDEIFENDYSEDNYYRAFFVGEKTRSFDRSKVIKAEQSTAWRYHFDILRDNFYTLLNVDCFKNRRKRYFAELFYDNGAGFVSGGIRADINTDAKGYFSIAKTFDLSGVEGIKHLRLDPVNSSCIIDSISVSAVTEGGKTVDLMAKPHPELKMISGKIVFISSDPQILLDEADDGDRITELNIIIKGTVYENLPDYLVDAYESDIANLKNKLSREKAKNTELETKVSELTDSEKAKRGLFKHRSKRAPKGKE